MTQQTLGKQAAIAYLEKRAFLGTAAPLLGRLGTAALGGARALGGKMLGAFGMGPGKGAVSNVMGATNAAGTLGEAKDLYQSRRAGGEIGG